MEILDRAVVFACDFKQYLTDIELPTLIDGNMEASGISAWTVWSGASVSKVSPGYSGTQCIRATTSLENQGMYQEVLQNGQPIRITGWCRGTVGQRVFAGGAGSPAQWDFPISSNWQRIDVSGTANGTRLYLTTSQNGAGYVEFDDIKVYQPRTCIKNYGRAGGAPGYMMCGDGFTSTSYPTPLSGFGASFNGDYINTGVVDRYEHTDTFSMYFFGTSQIGDRYAISNANSSFNGASFVSWAGYFRMFVRGITGANTYDISDGKTYIIAQSHYLSRFGASTILSTIKTGLPFMLGSAGYGGKFLPGTGYAFGIFDGVLTTRDISILDSYVRANIR